MEERKTLLAGDEGGSICGRQRNCIVGWDDRNIDQRGELIDQFLRWSRNVPGLWPAFCRRLICVFSCAICEVSWFTWLTVSFDASVQIGTLRSQIVRRELKAEATLPAAVRTPCRSDRSAGLVRSWLTLLKKFEIAVPISPLVLVKLVCASAAPKPARSAGPVSASPADLRFEDGIAHARNGLRSTPCA